MRTFRDIPIKQKLVIVMVLTTTAALLLAGVGIVASDGILFRQYLERDLSGLARIIADNSTAALAFNDPRSAGETLSALRTRPHLEAACIYRPDGSVLATYARSGSASGCPPAYVQDQPRFSGNDLTVARGIFLSGRQIGTLVMLSDLGELSERVRLYSATVIAVLLMSGLLAFLISSRLGAVIARPLSQLVQVTTSVSGTNDYSIRAHKVSGDELGVLVDRFNEMLAGIQSRDQNLRMALQDREAALREAESARERFRFMAESMPQKIFTATPSGDVDYFNQQWMAFTGLSFEQIKNWGWMQFIHPDDLDLNVQVWRHSVETGEPFLLQHRCRRADGEYRWHLSRAQAMRDAAGNISMWIGSNTDIHEQKEKEEELRRANDDLQQFAYSASHDLQEPIRNVAVYSEIIAKRYHNILDHEGQLFLGFLMEGGRRLATLINDLLAYTRAGVADGGVATADASLVLRHVLENLAEAIRESDAAITHDPLPPVYMSETHLQEVFQNLISNALKYRREEQPRVHISVDSSGPDLRFSVQDNGIGIDPQYREKIFGVFKRLHRDQKYSGTGIGLAICQRVVERYGGRIWVESTLGSGSTFHFVLPGHAPSRTQAAAAESSAR
jgi:PAS domain S-box-containing protein